MDEVLVVTPAGKMLFAPPFVRYSEKGEEIIPVYGFDIFERTKTLPLVDKNAGNSFVPEEPIYVMAGICSLEYADDIQENKNRVYEILWRCFVEHINVYPTHKHEEISEDGERFECRFFHFGKEDFKKVERLGDV